MPDLARATSDRRFPSRFTAYCAAVVPSTPVAPSLRVRRKASWSHSTSMWWERLTSARSGTCRASSAIRSARVSVVASTVETLASR